MDRAIPSISLTSPASSSSSLSIHVTYLLAIQSTRYSVSAGSWQYRGEWKMILWSKGRRKYRKKRWWFTAIIIVVTMCFGSTKERGLLPGEIQLLFHGGDGKLDCRACIFQLPGFLLGLQWPLHSFLQFKLPFYSPDPIITSTMRPSFNNLPCDLRDLCSALAHWLLMLGITYHLKLV